jgi:hypothetical protein
MCSKVLAKATGIEQNFRVTWPPSVSDKSLNRVWLYLKATVLEMHCETTGVRGEDSIGQALGEILQRAWYRIPWSLLDD